jgi:hypothetical protein
MILEEVMEDLIDSRIEEQYDYRPDLYPTKLLEPYRSLLLTCKPSTRPSLASAGDLDITRRYHGIYSMAGRRKGRTRRSSLGI